MTVNLKGCPKCGGDLIATYDADEKCQNCLQCGFVAYLGRPAKAATKQAARR